MVGKTAKGRKTRSAGRFGVRYGRRARKMVADIEDRTRGPHCCPSCGQTAVRRQGTGIWVCRKCGYAFAGGAYVPVTSLGRSVSRAVDKARTGDEEAAAGILAEADEGEPGTKEG